VVTQVVDSVFKRNRYTCPLLTTLTQNLRFCIL
jgi:hypothetical protein